MKARDFFYRAGALVAGKWVQDGLKALLLIWLARHNQAGFGLFVFAGGIALMLRSLLALGIDQFTIRELAHNPQTPAALLRTVIKLKVAAGLLSILALTALGLMAGWRLTMTAVVVIVATGQVLEALADSFFSLFRLQGRQAGEAAYSSLAYLVGTVYGALAIYLELGMPAISCFVFFCGVLKLLAAAWKSGQVQGIWQRAATKSNSWPNKKRSALCLIAGVSLLGTFYNQVQVFLLKYFGMLPDVAVFGAAMEIAGGLSGLVSSFIIGGVLYPSLVQLGVEDHDHLADTVKTYFWRMALYGLGIAFFISTLGGELLTIIYGHKYEASTLPLRILGPATLLSFLNNLLIYSLLAQGREKLLLWLHLAPFCLSLGLGLYLVPSLGPTGAALNLLACRLLMSSLLFTQAQRSIQIFTGKRLKGLLAGALILAVVYPLAAIVDHRLAAVVGLISYAIWAWRKDWPRRKRSVASGV